VDVSSTTVPQTEQRTVALKDIDVAEGFKPRDRFDRTELERLTRSVRYAVSTPMRFSSPCPARPGACRRGRAVARGCGAARRVVTMPTVGAIEKLSGRNASRVSSWLRPFVFCR
jgi:hypothetical protein